MAHYNIVLLTYLLTYLMFLGSPAVITANRTSVHPAVMHSKAVWWMDRCCDRGSQYSSLRLTHSLLLSQMQFWVWENLHWCLEQQRFVSETNWKMWKLPFYCHLKPCTAHAVCFTYLIWEISFCIKIPDQVYLQILKNCTILKTVTDDHY